MTFTEKMSRFLEPLKSSPGALFLSIVKYSLWAIYALLGVYIIRECARSISTGDFDALVWLMYEFSAFSVIFFVVSWFLRAYDWPILYHLNDRWIFRTYMQRFMTLDSTYIEKIGTGRMISIINTGEKVWVDGMSGIIKEGTKLVIVGTYMVYLFFSKSIPYGVTFIFALIILFILIAYIDSFVLEHRRKRSSIKSEFMRTLVRIIMSRNEIIQSEKTEREIENLESIIASIGDINSHINRGLFSIFNLVRGFITVAKIGLLVFAVSLGHAGMIASADVVALLALFIIFEGFLIDSVEFYKNFTKEFSDIEKLWETFDEAPENVRFSTGREFHFQRGDFDLHNISFSYNTRENTVFENFSLSIRGGKKTALVGHSGSGKTTLMKMLAGYLEPSSGKIVIDGEDFSEISLRSYYRHIGYLTQEPSVFDATIRENLMSAISRDASLTFRSKKDEKSISLSHLASNHSPKRRKEHRSDFDSFPSPLEGELENEKLIEALTLAHCDFVFSLEKGMDTEIGERGVRLSGGQKQRLAIAKIFLKDPEIILLDEPTSALDSFSEEAITLALDSLFEGRTVIIIAHRLQTVKKADDIIVMEEGKVVERGNHETLVSHGGIYAKMLELQSGF